MPQVMSVLRVGCDGLCMVQVVKMPACDIAIFRILSERSVDVKFRSRIGVGLKKLSDWSLSKKLATLLHSISYTV